MKLGFEQIKSITQGAENITNEDESIKFFRFRKEEEELYLNSEHRMKIFATAGIRLEFKTDGDFLNFKINTSYATSRTYFSIDVFVDNKFIGRCKNFTHADKSIDYTTKKFTLGEFSKKFEIGKGDKKVSIVFPWSVATELKDFDIENASYIEPVKRKKQMIVYGDSITNGYDALYSSHAYITRLADTLDAEIYNKAIGGEIFFPELAKIKNSINPDYVYVAYGSNDWSRTHKEDFYNRCKMFFKTLSENYPNSLIFAITPIWRKDFEDEKAFGNFSDVEMIIKDICNPIKNIKVITGFDLVPHNERYFADSRLHPNNEGFSFYYDNLNNAIKEIIKY